MAAAARSPNYLLNHAKKEDAPNRAEFAVVANPVKAWANRGMRSACGTGNNSGDACFKPSNTHCCTTL